MKPMAQTKLHDPSNNIRGNCFVACMASILELPIDDIPPLEEYADDEWVDVMLDFLHGRGLDIEMSLVPVDGYAIACGPSARGCGHSVVVQDGEMVHDPHPSQDGLKRVDHYLWIFKGDW